MTYVNRVTVPCHTPNREQACPSASQRVGAPVTMLVQGLIAIALALLFAGFLTRPAANPALTDATTEEVAELVKEEYP